MTRTFQYTVQAGDTLSKIAQHFKDVNLADIEQANPHINPNLIRIGQKIEIPATSTDSTPSTPTTDSIPTAPIHAIAEHVGYWDWTWHDRPAPEGATIGVAFSGRMDVDTVLRQSEVVYHRLTGEKYICFGGGGKIGQFDSASLKAITTAIQNDRFQAYQGIAYDVEMGTAGLAADFQTSFQAAKAKGLKVLVTVSHSAPFGIRDGAVLMHTFFADENIDFLSPQLYTSGQEKVNNYQISHGISWNSFATAKAIVLPSVAHASYYSDAQSYFSKHGVELKGFIRWSY